MTILTEQKKKKWCQQNSPIQQKPGGVAKAQGAKQRHWLRCFKAGTVDTWLMCYK